MRYVHTQSGAALIVLLTIFILGSLTFLLSEANDRSHYLVEDQEQTIRALTQAKESLLGFAATYAQNHKVKLQGYLPCPDKDGDGSAALACDSAGETVLGRLPWRTLGLPPLRDGSGECLWYAVSGNFKYNPKQSLTSDSNGMITMGNVRDQIITRDTIAVLFAPGRPLKGQEDRYQTTTEPTECGSKIANKVIEPINHVRNYLDKYNFDSVVNDNVTANNSIFYSARGNFATSPEINVIPRFINAPPAYEIYLHPHDGTEQLDHANPTFNDTVATITPADFRPIYRMMDYQVATQVRTCLDRYAQKSLYQFMKTTEDFIDEFIQQESTFFAPDETDHKKGILDKVRDNIKTGDIPYPKYSWTSNELEIRDDNDVVLMEINQGYFGKISALPIRGPVSSEDNLNGTSMALRNLTKEYIMSKEELNQNLDKVEDQLTKFENKWDDKKKEFFNIPKELPNKEKLTTQDIPDILLVNPLKRWPVDPQESFAIFDLHDLEYEELNNIDIEEIRQKVIDTLVNKTLVMVLEIYYFSILKDSNNIPLVEKITTAEFWEKGYFEEIKTPSNEEFKQIKTTVETEINGIFDKETLINNIKDIKYILESAPDLRNVVNPNTDQEVVDTKLAYLRDQYQCFLSDDTYVGPRPKWWWWPDWRDKVFFAIHSDYSLNNTIEKTLSFNTLNEPNIIKADMLVLVAGRFLNGQEERSPNDITRYLEGENSDGDAHFIHAPVTSTFNDVVL